MAVEHHSEPAPEITQAQIRQIIETEIEHLVSALDFFDPDPDLEPECEDEGAQCDDEGWVEEDCGASEDEGTLRFWWNYNDDDFRRAKEAQESTTKAAQAIVETLRAVMKRHGQRPVKPLRVLAGPIFKG